MNRLLLLTVLLIFVACADKITSSELRHLNGYWEIEKVVFPNGDTKEYDLSTTIDYLTLDSNKGYRKKVQPRLDGTYLTSDDAASFEIIETNGTFMLHYSNGADAWEERIIAISDQHFTVVSEENIRYYYKRYQPVTIGK